MRPINLNNQDLQSDWARTLRKILPKNMNPLFEKMNARMARKLKAGPAQKKNPWNLLENLSPEVWSNMVFVSDMAMVAVGESESE